MMKLFSIVSTLLFIGSVGAQSLGVTKLGQLTYTNSINDVWGYVDSATGTEYALVGVQDGLSIVNVDSAQNPTEVFFVNGANSIWRDMKSFRHYAYAVHDVTSSFQTDGFTIVDMNTIENRFPTFFKRKPLIKLNDSVSEVFERAHNIYIDENGILYAFGSNVGAGGALMFDLKPDPTNPQFLGIFNDYYLHDGVARGDTLWGAAVYNGFFSAIDVSSKTNPREMARKNTPFNFAHNIWFSDDNQRVFTTDERSAAYIAEYDVSDLNNIEELDLIRTSFGNDVVPHNAHFHNNFLFNSYYTSGLQIVDVSEPGVMVETGYYDTSPQSGDGFGGAWGAYPYLPSQHILVTDRQTGLWVFSSTFPRAAFFQCSVQDSVSGANLLNAQIDFINGSITGATDVFGNFKDGQRDSGVYDVRISKSGYASDTIRVTLKQGQKVQRLIKLAPLGLSVSNPQLWPAIELYPNPTAGTLNLAHLPGAPKALDLQILSLDGRLLYQETLAPGQTQWTGNLSLSAGTYLLRLRDEAKGSKQFTFIKR